MVIFTLGPELIFFNSNNPYGLVLLRLWSLPDIKEYVTLINFFFNLLTSYILIKSIGPSISLALHQLTPCLFIFPIIPLLQHLSEIHFGYSDISPAANTVKPNTFKQQSIEIQSNQKSYKDGL